MTAHSAGLDVAGQPESAEDLAADRVVPVAERASTRHLVGAERAAAQHLVVAAEKHLGVLGVRERLEPGVRLEIRGGPLPHVTDQVMHTGRGGTVGVRAHVRRFEMPLVQIGMCGSGFGVAPRVRVAGASVGVEARGLLPLGLRRQTLACPAGVGVGLEPAHVHHG